MQDTVISDQESFFDTGIRRMLSPDSISYLSRTHQPFQIHIKPYTHDLVEFSIQEDYSPSKRRKVGGLYLLSFSMAGGHA